MRGWFGDCREERTKKIFQPQMDPILKIFHSNRYLILKELPREKLYFRGCLTTLETWENTHNRLVPNMSTKLPQREKGVGRGHTKNTMFGIAPPPPILFLRGMKVINNLEEMENHIMFMLKSTSSSPLKIPNPWLNLPLTNLPHRKVFWLLDRENPMELDTNKSGLQQRVILERGAKTWTNLIEKAFMKPISGAFILRHKEGDHFHQADANIRHQLYHPK